MSKEKDDAGKKSTKTSKGSEKSKSFFTDDRIKFVTGILITGFAVYLIVACVSYLFWWKTDSSATDLQVFSGADTVVRNRGGKLGHYLAAMIIKFGFGFGAFFIPLIFGTIGLSLLNFPKLRVWSLITKFALAAILLSLILSFIFVKSDNYLGGGPGGAQGYMIIQWSNAFMGMIGTGVVLLFITLTYSIFALKVKPESFGLKLPAFIRFKKLRKPRGTVNEENISEDDETAVIDEEQHVKDTRGPRQVQFLVNNTNVSSESDEYTDEFSELVPAGSIIRDFDNDEEDTKFKEDIPADISRPDTGDLLSEKKVDSLRDNYDPRLDLSRYKFPPVSILKEHKSESAFDNNEVFENK